MKQDEQRRIQRRAALLQALSQLDKGKPLPLGLANALDSYALAFRKRVTRELLAPKLVQRCVDARLPRTKLPSFGQGAFERVAEQVGLSESTVERAYRDFPPDSEKE